MDETTNDPIIPATEGETPAADPMTPAPEAPAAPEGETPAV